MVATISGPLGQRDSSGTGTAGYRIHVTLAGELELAPAPTPSPVPTPTPSPSPTPTPTATPMLGHADPEPDDPDPDAERHPDPDRHSRPRPRPPHRPPVAHARRDDSPWTRSAPCRSAARLERPASSIAEDGSPRRADAARDRRCGRAAWSSTSRRRRRLSARARGSTSPGSSPRHTASSRSVRPRRTSTCSGPGACRRRSTVPPSGLTEPIEGRLVTRDRAPDRQAEEVGERRLTFISNATARPRSR